MNHGSDYYNASIADQVRLLKESASSNTFDYDGVDANDYTSFFHTPASIKRLKFEMWVSTPENVFKSLHNYTCISVPDEDQPSPTIELERYENWEMLFPDLKSVLQEGQIDVVLLKSRFDLMSDYPPATSKLVLDLDLDFRDFEKIKSGCNWMRYFTSVNHLYYNGKSMQKIEHKDCLAVEAGVVKPFFEAEWWATQFTKVTRKMKEAEEAQNPDMVAAAEEYSRGLFRGLTIMQEIFVSSQHSDCMTSQSQKKRVAVLLWVFAQTNKRNNATTTWQHVTVQSSCLPQAQFLIHNDACLPPLSMNIAIDDPFNIDMTGSGFSLHEAAPMSPIPYEVGAYHSGFTPYHPHQELQTNFDFGGATDLTSQANSFTEIKPDPMNLMAELHQIPPFLPSQDISDDKVTLFNLPTQPLYEDMSGPGPSTYDVSDSLPTDLTHGRNTLANFDMSTHDMLQAQLADFHPDDTNTHASIQALSDIDIIDNDSLAYESAQPLHDIEAIDFEIPDADPDSQQSMIGHMDSLDLDEESLSQALLDDTRPTTPNLNHAKLMLEHPTLFESPKVTRPPLLAHNSFAGVLPDAEDEPLHFDTPTRDEFARVISGHLDRDEDLFGSDGVTDGFDLGRPRSQPVLGSNECGTGYSRLDPVCLGTLA